MTDGSKRIRKTQAKDTTAEVTWGYAGATSKNVPSDWTVEA